MSEETKIPTTLESAIAVLKSQEYLIVRHQEILDEALRQNRMMVATGNDMARENHKLRKELDGYKRGKLWTMFASFLPTMEVKWRDEP